MGQSLAREDREVVTQVSSDCHKVGANSASVLSSNKRGSGTGTPDRGLRMIRPSKWFERKFEFAIPVEQFPNLCSRLHGTPARLDDLLRGHSHEELTRRDGQKWSIQEHAGHLF